MEFSVRRDTGSRGRELTTGVSIDSRRESGNETFVPHEVLSILLDPEQEHHSRPSGGFTCRLANPASISIFIRWEPYWIPYGKMSPVWVPCEHAARIGSRHNRCLFLSSALQLLLCHLDQRSRGQVSYRPYTFSAVIIG